MVLDEAEKGGCANQARPKAWLVRTFRPMLAACQHHRARLRREAWPTHQPDL